MRRLTTILFMVVIRPLALYLGLMLLGSGAHAAVVLHANAMVQYHNLSSDRLLLDIRSASETPIDMISARIGGIEVALTQATDDPSEQQTRAVLFLVDTSDPGRQQAIDEQIRHIEQVLGYKHNYFRYGLARFDTDLHLLAPIGSSTAEIIKQAGRLKAEGKTTELYRNTLGAIELLERYPADRKFLFMLSDGLAEDQAYFHRDVVQAAIKSHVSLFALGYADTMGHSVALQTLRRLAEDTGGLYLASVPGKYTLNQQRLQKMFDHMNDGGRYIADLGSAIEGGLVGKQFLTLSVSMASQQAIINLPVSLPASNVVTTKIAEVAAPQVIIERVSQPSKPVIYLPWLLIGLGILLAALIIVLANRLRGDRAASAAVSKSTDVEAKPFAWLEMVDNQGRPRRYPLRSFETKIGRYRGNDIALRDSGVSRYHAEIHLTDSGEFIVTDMGSKNGLLVNDKEVREQRLHNNDVIEIGDSRLRFIVEGDPAADMQVTQMFRTQLPPRDT